MRQSYHSILKWSLLTGTSTILFKLLYESTFTSTLRASSKSFTTYENTLIHWASTGEYSKAAQKKSIDTKIPDNFRLIGAQIYFRHGARTPLSLLPRLEEVSYTREQIEMYPPSKWDVKLITKLGNDIVSRDKILSGNEILRDRTKKLKSASDLTVVTGQLTAVGEKQLYQLGKLIRSEIIENDQHQLIPNQYDPDMIFCRSTYMERTIASARSFLAGLYSSEKGDKNIQAKGPFEIEVHNFPDEDMFPNPNVAPVLKQCHKAIELHELLDDTHDLKKARQALLDYIDLKDTPQALFDLHDEIVSRQAHNFSIPNDIAELTKNFDVLGAREFFLMVTSIGFDSFIRSTCGPLLYLMRENFEYISKNVIEENENNINKPYKKFFIYSGHDTTLFPLLMALEIFPMRWPEYASYIFIKFYASKTNPNETYVAVDYAGEPQLLPNCDTYYCPYSTFIKNLENRFEKPKYLMKT